MSGCYFSEAFGTFFDLVSVALDTSRVPTRHEKGDDVSGALHRRQVQSLCFGVIPYGRLSFLPSFLSGARKVFLKAFPGTHWPQKDQGPKATKGSQATKGHQLRSVQGPIPGNTMKSGHNYYPEISG